MRSETYGRSVVGRDLYKSFGATVALAGVDLSLGAGVYGFLGPNGAGKTTLLRIMATVMPPDRGSLELFELDPSHSLEAVRSRLGYVPQEPGFYSHFSVTAFLDYISILRGMSKTHDRREAIERVLPIVGLEASAGKKIRALSGGQRRRLAIAQALLAEPRLLILDEPFAGLDPEQRLRLRSLLVELGRRTTLVVSTHQTEDVAHLCDQVMVLDRGRIRFTGTAAELAAVAEGRVWLGPPTDRSDFAQALAGDVSRHLGARPDGREPAEPNVEDGYLSLLARDGDG
ncbi:MAG: ATP-binding cassette domain-containing protein [Actinobacteria bacterium]|nr:ATP-binding cassette domain-containing protein [Actinomycetota bacterium]